eukprot:TRINITY_DN908_c0_g1_i1.p3 TRINITY_DN908_c0_g1~~TRINITY_DN908_c0_g1_i1.p3  ORF type:complete len:117 (+),score=17.30 TRINITY_DN908_c0_g1_i1:158-508(+)
MFIQVYALPCPESKPPIVNRDSQRAAHQGRFHVGRHVIIALVEMAIVVALGNKLVEGIFHVERDIRTCILVDGQARRCVHKKDVCNSNLELAELGHCLFDMPRYDVAPSGQGGQLD